MYQKVNSSIVSEGAMNSFNEMFPPAIMHPLTPPPIYIFDIQDKNKNKLMRESCFLHASKLQKNQKNFNKQHQVDIWFEIIPFFSIKRS